MSGGQRPAQLDGDDVMRFIDGEHFLEELTANLGRGRAFVQSERELPVNARLAVTVQAPGVNETVTLQATVVFARQGYAGLELTDFEEQLESLDRLGQAVEGEITSPLAKEPTPLPPSAFVDDDAETGPLIVPSEVREAVAEGVAPPASTPSSDDLTAALTAYLADLPLPEADPTPTPLPEPAPRPPRPRGDTLIAPPPSFETERSGIEEATESLEPEPEIESAESDPHDTLTRSMTPDLLEVATPTDPGFRRPDSVPPPSGSAPAEEPTADAAAAASPADAPAEEAPGHREANDDDATVDAPSHEIGEADDAQEAPPDVQATVDQTVQDVPRADPEPSSPVVDGAEALEALGVLRASPGGAVRFSSPAHLLGAWLYGLHEGLLTVHGGPDGGIGETVSLKLVAGRVVTVDAEIRARIGPWLTVEIGEREEIRGLIADNVDAWRPSLEPLGLAPAPSEPPPPPVSPPEPPPASNDLPNTPLSNPGLAVSPQSSAGLSTERLMLPEPASGEEAPQPPRVSDGRVLFRHAGDLRKELETDLRNGGLFVESEPLPLRSKHELTLVVGDIEIPGTIEADVVFANSGKVGFSVPGADALCSRLQQLLVEGLPAPAEAPSSFEANLEGEGTSSHGLIGPPPAVEQLIELESQRTGDLDGLSQQSVVGLFDELVSSRFKGVLRLEGDDKEQRKVYFHEGNVAFLESSPFEEVTSLGRILAQHRRVSESALRTALDKAKRNRTPLGRSLISLGFAKSGDVVSALREQTRSRLEQSFGWRAGAFALGPWEDPPGRGQLIVTRGVGILANHLRRRFDQMGVDELEELLGPSMGAVVRSTESLERVAGPLGLQAKELRFLQVSIDGRRSMEEAIRLSPVGKLASLRLAAVGLSLGLLKTEANGQPTAPRAHSRGTGSKLRSELSTKLEQLTKENHFDVLGVHWSSHPRTFADAYQVALAEFAVAKGPYRSAPPDVQDLARACAARVKTAFDVLSDESQRVAYRAQLFNKTERQFAAQMLVEKGEVALLRGDRLSAIEHLESAFELSPSDRHRSLLRSARDGRQP